MKICSILQNIYLSGFKLFWVSSGKNYNCSVWGNAEAHHFFPIGNFLHRGKTIALPDYPKLYKSYITKEPMLTLYFSVNLLNLGFKNDILEKNIFVLYVKFT